MHDALDDLSIDQDTRLAVVVVELPDPTWGPAILDALEHKERIYLEHLEASQAGSTDGLTARFYVGTHDDEIVSLFMVVSSGRYGILGHVYTVPEFRRRGISSRLLDVGLDEEERRGVTEISLGVAPDSTASRIYERHGFVIVHPGAMIRATASAAAPASADQFEVGALAWRDWPGLNWSLLSPIGDGEPLPRSPLFGVRERWHGETSFLFALLDSVAGRAEHSVLRAADGTVAGWSLWKEPDIDGAPARLDVHVLAGFESALPDLIEKAHTSPLSYLSETDAPAYTAALEDAGFSARPDAASGSEGLPLHEWTRTAR